MKKRVFGRRFKRDKNQRKALFKSLISSLIIEGRIKTTEQKAKAIKADVDKLVTKGKNGASKTQLSGSIVPSAMDKFMLQIVPSYKNRNGGYTRIVRNGVRESDSASLVIMEWVEGEKVEMPKVQPKAKTVKKSKPTSRKAPSAKGRSKNAKK